MCQILPPAIIAKIMEPFCGHEWAHFPYGKQHGMAIVGSWRLSACVRNKTAALASLLAISQVQLAESERVASRHIEFLMPILLISFCPFIMVCNF